MGNHKSIISITFFSQTCNIGLKYVHMFADDNFTVTPNYEILFEINQLPIFSCFPGFSSTCTYYRVRITKGPLYWGFIAISTGNMVC